MLLTSNRSLDAVTIERLNYLVVVVSHICSTRCQACIIEIWCCPRSQPPMPELSAMTACGNLSIGEAYSQLYSVTDSTSAARCSGEPATEVHKKNESVTLRDGTWRVVPTRSWVKIKWVDWVGVVDDSTRRNG